MMVQEESTQAQVVEPAVTVEQEATGQTNEVNEMHQKLLGEYQQLQRLLKTTMVGLSYRGAKRVLGSLMAAPFEQPAKFQHPLEQQAFSIGMRIMDIKMLLVTEAVRDLEKTKQEPQQVEETKQEEVTQNG